MTRDRVMRLSIDQPTISQVYKSFTGLDPVSRLAKLTEREREVMVLAIQGYSNKKIVSCLGISHRTVEIHKSKIIHKTGAVNLLDLARVGHEGGLNEVIEEHKKSERTLEND